MEFDEIMRYTQEHGEPPEDALYYKKISPFELEEVLANCVIFTTECYKAYTQVLFRSVNNIDWYSLRIRGFDEFEVARWQRLPDGTMRFVQR